MNKIKLLIFAPQSIHTRKWVEPFLNDNDFEVLVVSFDLGNREILNGLPAKTVKSKFGKFGYFFSVNKFKKIFDEFKPDLIHAHFVTSYGYIASKIGFHPLVLSAWGSDITLAEKSSLRRRIVRSVLNSSDYVNFAGEYLKDMAIKIGFDLKKPHDVFQYGVDTQNIVKYRKPIDDRENLIISPRGFAEVYNVKNQILAMKNVVEKNSTAKLFMYGGGDSSKAKKLVDELHLNDSVKIIGKVDQNTLWSQIGKSLIVLSVPFRDGTPLSLLESMALGAFPVVSKIPPNEEWVEDRKNGLLVDEDSPEEIAKAINLALENSEIIRSSFDCNLEIIRLRADYLKNIQKIKEIYKSYFKYRG
ncbi:glycosyltransferase family 4 protein [Athalassotoga saccharophila]|uniref:glycosyltransferase family 4 protein n=1 Tax=Athalassotoga saccharophila TaxID=1441386 RepID=UPI00137A09F9|nr:glycosyltransferase family 4 protein [Athalassotoga saccharophila]BBJ28321.1 N-acetyl-alpha-D-glucosaminyl L-malate synthase [Athalassotoga saccharophila]